MRGWRVKTSENPYSFRAEKRGFTITSGDGKTFTVTDPDGNEVNTLGTSLEAVRVAEACINRLPAQ